MEKKSRIRQPEFWDSAPSELERLTFFGRLEEKEQMAEGWRRNILYAAGFVLALLVIVLFTRLWR
ncbi:MAG: hypothetical protein EOP70_08775 [Variovorax sp.]|jgi:hypothetical protein|nr:MAG: hypothetical protein EOP70_08775 [Variovorax sp.]